MYMYVGSRSTKHTHAYIVYMRVMSEYICRPVKERDKFPFKEHSV